MQVTIVSVHVKEEKINDFKEACRLNHEQSIQEPGNLRFDVIQQRDEPDKFVLYEAYQSEEDAKKHKETQHYLNWRATVADWMASPRVGVVYDGHFPE